jgi:hypothetical protein
MGMEVAMAPIRQLLPALVLLALAGCAGTSANVNQASADDGYQPEDFDCSGYSVTDHDSLLDDCAYDETTDSGRDWVRGHHR